MTGESLYIYGQQDGYQMQFIRFINGVGRDCRFVPANRDFKHLLTALIGECSFGEPIGDERPLYDLSLTHGAIGALKPDEVKLLEIVVNYHNHIVEKGNQNRGG